MTLLLASAAAVAGGLLGAQTALAVPPSASFTAPSTLLVDESGTFTSTTPDPDADGHAIASVQWDFQNDGTFDASGPSVSHSYGSAGVRTVRMTVTDSAGESAEATRTVTVRAPPTASIAFAPSVPDVGETVSFDGSGSSDPDGTIAGYAWDLDGDGFDDGTSATASRAYDTGGTKTARLRVTDNHGLTNVATVSFRVNALPVARLLFAALNREPGQDYRAPIVGEQQVGFVSQSTDDRQIVLHEWLDDFAGGGPFGGNDDVPPPHAPYAAAGEKQIKLRVTDDDGAVGEAIGRIRVNTRPTANFGFTPPTPVVGEQIALNAAVSDPDPTFTDAPNIGAITKVEWDLNGDGTFEKTGNQATASFPSAGTRNVKLRVTDGGGAQREFAKAVPVKLDSAQPRAEFGFAPSFPLPGQVTRFTSTSRAVAGRQIVSQEWDFDYDPASAFGADANGATASHAFATRGPHVVALRVTETGGGIDITTRTVVVNAPPTASFTASPDAPVSGDKVTFASTSTDPDGPISHAWDTDDDGQFDDATGTVATRTFAQPGTYRIRLLVTDDRGTRAISEGSVRIAKRQDQAFAARGGGAQLLAMTVQFSGRTTKRGARLTRLIVRAPVGTRVRVKCRGDDCPAKRKSVTMKRSELRLKKLQRALHAGTRIVIDGTLDGFVGRRVVLKIRKGKAPKRKDRCLQPGAERASACP